MSPVAFFNSPFLLGFDQIEQLMEHISKNANEAYPPYNIQHLESGTIRITVSVAGFSRDDLEITWQDSQLCIRGKQSADVNREYLHRGIAARQFQRKFVLANGMKVTDATLDKGLLHIDLVRPEPKRTVTSIPIRNAGDE